MFQDCFHFDKPCLGHINNCVGLLSQRAPHFFWHVGFITFHKQLGEICSVACRREYRFERNLPCSAVIRVVDAVGGKQVLGVAGDKDVRFEMRMARVTSDANPDLRPDIRPGYA